MICDVCGTGVFGGKGSLETGPFDFSGTVGAAISIGSSFFTSALATLTACCRSRCCSFRGGTNGGDSSRTLFEGFLSPLENTVVILKVAGVEVVVEVSAAVGSGIRTFVFTIG